MQQAIPYRTWIQGPPAGDPRPPARDPIEDPVSANTTSEASEAIKSTVTENAVVVFGRRGCCMCHVLRRLLLDHGVNPPVYEVDEEREAAVVEELSKLNAVVDGDGGENCSGKVQFPVVFVGGKVFGGLERVIASHISGELLPILRKAGALWL